MRRYRSENFPKTIDRIDKTILDHGENDGKGDAENERVVRYFFNTAPIGRTPPKGATCPEYLENIARTRVHTLTSDRLTLTMNGLSVKISLQYYLSSASILLKTSLSAPTV
jgi:hypothetical protein